MKKCVCGREFKNLSVHQRTCKVYLATKEPTPPEPTPPDVKTEELVAIYLPRQITINSTKYIGHITVPLKLARTLRSISDAAESNNIREKTPKNHSRTSPFVSVGKGGIQEGKYRV